MLSFPRCLSKKLAFSSLFCTMVYLNESDSVSESSISQSLKTKNSPDELQCMQMNLNWWIQVHLVNFLFLVVQALVITVRYELDGRISKAGERCSCRDRIEATVHVHARAHTWRETAFTLSDIINVVSILPSGGWVCRRCSKSPAPEIAGSLQRTPHTKCPCRMQAACLPKGVKMKVQVRTCTFTWVKGIPRMSTLALWLARLRAFAQTSKVNFEPRFGITREAHCKAQRSFGQAQAAIKLLKEGPRAFTANRHVQNNKTKNDDDTQEPGENVLACVHGYWLEHIYPTLCLQIAVDLNKAFNSPLSRKFRGFQDKNLVEEQSFTAEPPSPSTPASDSSKHSRFRRNQRESQLFQRGCGTVRSTVCTHTQHALHIHIYHSTQQNIQTHMYIHVQTHVHSDTYVLSHKHIIVGRKSRSFVRRAAWSRQESYWSVPKADRNSADFHVESAKASCRSNGVEHYLCTR